MLDARVLALGVLADQDGIDVVVGGLVTGDGPARADVGEEIEGAAEGQVEGDVPFANGRSQRALESHQVLGHAVDGLVGNDGLAVLVQARGDVDRLPLNGHLGGRVDVLDRLCNLGADAVTLDERDAVLAIAALGAVELGDLGGVGAGRDLAESGLVLWLAAASAGVAGTLTWHSAGAHRERLGVVWRRHCRAGAAKERAASMVMCRDEVLRPNWSFYTRAEQVEDGGRCGGRGEVEQAQSSEAEKASSTHPRPIFAKPATSDSRAKPPPRARAYLFCVDIRLPQYLCTSSLTRFCLCYLPGWVAVKKDHPMYTKANLAAPCRTTTMRCCLYY